MKQSKIPLGYTTNYSGTEYFNSLIPDDIKNLKCRFTALSEIEELNKYLSVLESSTNIANVILDELKQFRDSPKSHNIPVCVLSYKYSKCSFHLKQLLNESKIHDLNREYIIFTNDDSTYADFKNIKNVRIEIVPNEVDSLYLKRVYVLKYCQNHNIDNAFFVEDDCYSFALPIPGFSNNGTYKNFQYIISNNLCFDLWEYMILKHNLKISGIRSNINFAFKLLVNEHFCKQFSDNIQCIHINTKFCKDNDIMYDPNSGWDDYDFELQFMHKGIPTTTLYIMYCTPALKSGVSTHTNLEERCRINTNKLVSKWSNYVKIDTKKGLYNSKINWKKCKELLNNEQTEFEEW